MAKARRAAEMAEQGLKGSEEEEAAWPASGPLAGGAEAAQQALADGAPEEQEKFVEATQVELQKSTGAGGTEANKSWQERAQAATAKAGGSAAFAT